MKEFDIELAKQGKPVCTRDGRKVRIVCYDAKGCYPIVALVDNGELELLISCCEDGRLFSEGEENSMCDLMMASEKHEGWVNIIRYKGGEEGEYISIVQDFIFDSEEEAKSYEFECYERVQTIKIEWEE